MNKEELNRQLNKITPQIIKLEVAGKTRYTSAKCEALWKETRRIQYILKNLP